MKFKNKIDRLNLLIAHLLQIGLQLEKCFPHYLSLLFNFINFTIE